MRQAPKANCGWSGVLKRNLEHSVELIVATPDDKPLATLSMYLITAATSRPPHA